MFAQPRVVICPIVYINIRENLYPIQSLIILRSKISDSIASLKVARRTVPGDIDHIVEIDLFTVRNMICPRLIAIKRNK
jgi:hypothetical protein